MSSRTLRTTTAIVATVAAVAAIDAAGAAAMPAHHRAVPSLPVRAHSSAPPGLHATQRPAVRAHVTSAVAYPYVGDTQSTCDAPDQYVRVYPPVDVMPRTSGTAEVVYWRDDLYRYSASGWQLVDVTPWTRGVAWYNGLQTLDVNGSQWAWYDAGTRTYVTRPFWFGWAFGASYHVHGSYEVLQHVQWSNGLERPTLSRFETGYVCTY